MKARALFTIPALLATMALVGTCHAEAFIVWGTGEDGPGTGGAKNDAGNYLPGTRALGPIDLANGALVQLWKAVNDVDDPRDHPGVYADPSWCIDDELLDEAHVGYGLVPPGSPGDGEFSRTAHVDIEVGDVLYVRIYNVPKPDLGGPLPGGCEVGLSMPRTVTDQFSSQHPGRSYYFDNVQTEPLIPPCVEVTDDVQEEKSNMRYNRRTGMITFDMTLTNIGPSAIPAPLILVVEDISPHVTLLNPDGTTAGGKPFFDYSHLLDGDGVLSPTETSGPKTWQVHNPTRTRWSFSISVWSGPMP